MNINISLNPTLTSGIKLRLQQGGYSNISEYIRDLLRHDLRLTHDEYPYDYEYIEELGSQYVSANAREELDTADFSNDQRAELNLGQSKLAELIQAGYKVLNLITSLRNEILIMLNL